MVVGILSNFSPGRKEITLFFYLYMALTIVSLILDAGVVPPTSGALPFFVAIQNGLTSAMCTSLLINGFVGFQLYEDGTRQSMWMIRGCSAIMFIICGAVSILTFENTAGLSPTNTTGLFVVLFLINAIFLLIYVIMQLILVTNTLQDRWPLGDILFGIFFFVAGQIIVYVFGAQICEGVNHYLDGLVFATTCNLLAVMMVYKFWDSITKEDLEFSVGTKQGNWEVKEPYSDSGDRTTYYDDPSTITGPGGQRNSTYGERRASVYGGGF